MTNQTIDGVPRAMAERIHACLEAHRYAESTKLAKELRALLDAPVECRCKRYGKDNPHWPCPVHAAPAAQPQGEPVAIGYVLAKQTAVEVPGQVRKELGYTLIDGIGIFHSADEVHAAILELGLPLGWVSMTVDQLLPGYMASAYANQPAPE